MAYNYTIGSKKGQDEVKIMKEGETYNASDGSVWTKKSDGSISVNTSDGKTYDNAYIPSYNTDTDYGTVGRQQMSYGASGQDVYNTYKQRYDKAINTPGLEQYANDDLQKEMLDYYINSMRPDKAENWNNDYERAYKPTEYRNEYKSRMDKMLNQILNRDDFSYDAQSDPLYQQYAKMYAREGDRAMKETMAEAAAGAGGMNSYATTAAQQAANRYSAQLNDKIPQLYQLAYDMYLSDKDSKIKDLGILQKLEENQYARYRDTMNDYRSDRNFAYGMYQDDVAQGNWDKTFNYNKEVSDRDFNYNSDWAEKQWDYQKEQDAINNSRYDRESAKEELWKLISLGITPSADLIARSGMSQEDINLAVAAIKATTANTYQASGRSSGGTSRKSTTGKKTTGKKSNSSTGWDGNLGSANDNSWIAIPGLGRISYDELDKYVRSGKVKETYDKNENRVRYTLNEKNTNSENNLWNRIKGLFD